MHITLRRRSGLPSFREQLVHELVVASMARLNDHRFQIVHHSIQTNHIHLVVEADDRDVVTRKMSGFAIAFAKRLNNQLLGGRRGKVWSDRSSAWRFAGFDVCFAVPAGMEHVPRPTPRTRLLRRDWLAWGLVPVAGAPGARRA